MAHASSLPLLSLHDVSVTINNKPILNNITLQVHANEIVSVIGPNGAGKSTLVKTLLGIRPATTGSVSKMHGLRIGYVPQKFNVPTHLPLRVCDFLGTLNNDHINIMDELQLQPLWQSAVQTLSGGERQRVLLANALNNNPNLIILDEPMQGLDLDSEDNLYHFVSDLPKRANVAVLIISHDIHWVMQGTKRVVCINKHICCEGSPVEVQQHASFKALYKTHQVFYEHQHTHCEHTSECNHEHASHKEHTQ